MKLFIPFKERDIGGTSIFSRKFAKGMKERGHEIVFEHCSDYDVLFVIADCPLKYVIDAKRKGKKIVQRLDGCYYYTVSGWKYPLLNLKAKIIHNYFADYVVYQSKYSKYSCNKFLGKSPEGRWNIIYNGVDTKRFSSKGSIIDLRDHKNQKIIITVSRFRRKDQIVPILKSMEELSELRDDFKLLVIGSLSKDLQYLHRNSKHIKFLGKVKNEDLPKYERGADVFIMTHLNPPCPNNIIEALSCGLPICGINDGAMNELVKNHVNGELVATEGDAFFKPREYDTSLIAEKSNVMMDAIHDYKKRSGQRNNVFGVNYMIKQYLKIFKMIIRGTND